DSFDLTPDESDSTRPASASSSSTSSVLGAQLTKKLHSFNQFFWQNLGLFLIILSQFFNSLMVVTTKLLVKDPEFADDPIHPAQILFVRMIITALGCYLYLRYVMKMDHVFGPPEIRIWLVARGVAGFFGVFSIYYSLMYLSVSDAVTITFLVPSVTGFLAWVCLREKWSLMEAGGGLISLVGVLLISRPSFIFGTHTGSGNDQVESSDPKERLIGTLVGLVGVVGASSVYIVIRKIRGKVHSLITVQYFAISCVFITLTALLVVPGLSFKLPRSAKQWALFFGLGISGFCMQFLLTEGIMREKASRASSMLYVQIIYSIFWEIVIWGHVPGFSSVCGIVIILGAAFVVIYYKPKESEESPKPAADLESGSVRLEDYPATTQSRGISPPSKRQNIRTSHPETVI
ncbi:hypothetical protein WICPIJ_009579, partial [Wickerhamomyces pijperi]